MEEFKVFIQIALSIFGGVSVIAGGVSAIIKLFSPIRKLKKRVEDNEKKLENDYAKIESVTKALNDVDETNKEICKSILVLMNHEITGNSIDKLKEQRDELEKFLIEK